MGKSVDVVALGELLMDFTENGVSSQGNTLFEANPGGAPCNVLAMLKKLGKSAVFIGKVKDDMFGRTLRQVSEGAGIDMGSILVDGQARTTLAFVRTLPGGDRDFSFYRSPGADMTLRADELPMDLIKSARIFHFCTLSMTHPGVREATAWYGGRHVHVPGVGLGGVIETTGAGDTFCACVLGFVLDRGLEGLTDGELVSMLRFANAAAYLVTTKKGAIRSMPERREVEAILPALD